MKKIRRSEIIPKYGSRRRNILIDALHENQDYKKSMEKGLPFYSQKELDKIKKKYKDGMTWSEIDTELSKKGVIMKKATFRSYIQSKNISSAIAYKKNERGREAIYPSDTIKHINFIQYFYRMADNDFIITLLHTIEILKVNAKDAIEDRLEHNNLYRTIMNDIDGYQDGDDNLEEIIRYVLRHDTDFLQKVLSNHKDLVESFHTKYNKLIEMLESYNIPMIHRQKK